ncbi:hypothetical protein MMC24_006878 [Lignoscripta atroalba]|nr:hypothetical protein [Lignoscripta atroalba]
MQRIARLIQPNDPALAQFNTLLQHHLYSRRCGYRQGAIYEISVHPHGGYSSSVFFQDHSNNHYLVKSPEGLRYHNTKQANGAASRAALEILKAGKRPPLDDCAVQTTSAPASDEERIERLEKITKHVFKDRELALRALRHNKAGKNNNDALAFLGDAAIGYLMALDQYTASPNADGYHFHYVRKQLIANYEFQRIAKKVGMEELIEMSAAIAGQGTGKKVLSDTVEAVIGVLMLEGGPDAVYKFWRSCH